MERFRGHVRKHRVDDRHPYIIYDPNKCILCSRCIRTCARVLPISALGLVGRGFRTEMRPAMNDPLVETSCVSCGNCVDACPTGALTVKYPFPGRAALHTVETETSCAFCSLACPLTVRSFGAHRYFTEPAGPAGSYLCRYGRFGTEMFIKQERITGASIRERTARRDADLCDAQRETVAGLRRIADKYGPEAVGIFVSPELTCEELHTAALIAREGLGTNNVASLSVLGSTSAAGALDGVLGFTASTADRSCIRDADLIICNNTSLESDHLILAVDVIEAVGKGARLIVSNSTLDTTDQLLGSVRMDPMRGRAAVLWNEIIRLLMEQGRFDGEAVASLPGAGELLAAIKARGGDAAAMAGVSEAAIRQAADFIAAARSVVIVHSPDRRQDQAPGDLETMADLLLLLRAAGARAQMLLPRIGSNSAALGLCGADPEFAPGRRPAPKGIAGARTRNELLGMLERGEIRGALVVGEDPMAWGPTGAWLQNIEFLAAIDWTPTETTRFADVVLPGSTFLETAGTRCNFEGRVIRYVAAVPPPAGISGREVLDGLAAEFGVKAPADHGAALEREILEGTGPLAPYYWNTGQERPAWDRVRLVAPDMSVAASPIMPPLTHTGRYKREIREVGTARFRVH
jgi:formate dehydrogenase major subunit